MEGFFIILLIAIAIFHIILLAAIVFAAMAFFGEDKSRQADRYAMAAKLILILGLITLVGVGICFGLITVNF